MDRSYLDEELRRVATDPTSRPKGWSDSEIADFRLLVQCARAAHVPTDLRNTRLLRIEPGGTDDPDRAQATLTSGRVISLTFKGDGNAGAVLFDLGDYAETGRAS